MSYDFKQLSARDFELLVRDLLQAEWGVNLESFKTGKDGGIDLRYATAGTDVVVQCKHYLGSGLRALMRAIQNEKGKVQRLAPERYVVVTSVPLSPKNKDEIVRVFSGSILARADVLGADDLNNLLGKHPEVEGRHFKLWLASRAVLDRVLHNATVTRSELKAKQVYLDARRYVQSKAYPSALELLEEYGVVIVAGPPGVGKTTLANLLLYEHLERGYQAVVVQGNVKEGLDMFQAGTRQVFHFDDFLGATFLGDDAAVLRENGDRAVAEFFRAVRSSPDARLIVTTREHIFAQARVRSERLREANLGEYRVVLRMRSYSTEQRAEILYNHLYFGGIPKRYLAEILRGDFYLHIVKHRKFNPRIVEWLSSYGRDRRVPVGEYRAFVRGLLDDPSEIWRHAYEREISDAARSMLLALFSLGGSAEQEHLSEVFAKLHEKRCREYGFVRRPEDFRNALRELGGAFVTLDEKDGVRVHDASVLDLMNAVVGEVPGNAVDIVVAAHEFGQIERVWALSKAEKGKQIQRHLAIAAAAVASGVRECMAEPRGSSEGWYGWALEGRFSLIVEMAEAMPDTGIKGLIGELFGKIVDAWKTRGPRFEDGIGILAAISGSGVLTAGEKREWSETVRSAMLGAMEDEAYVSDELAGMASIVDQFDAPEAALNAIRRAFDEYLGQVFSQELDACRNTEEMDTLGGFLEDFQALAGVEVASLLDKIEEAKDEFRKRQSDLGDHLYDEWKDRRAANWARSKTREGGEKSIRDMFDSLN